MPSKPSLRLLTVASLSTLLVIPALAQSNGPLYGGLGLGHSKVDLHPDRMAGHLNPAFDANIVSRDEGDTGYKLFAGYQMSPRFGLEAGYYRLGDFNFRAQQAMPAGLLNASLRGQGLNLDLVGNWPLTEHLSVLGRFGAAATRAQSDFSGSGSAVPGIAAGRDTAIDAKFGLGLQYALSSNLWLRGEVERYRITDTLGGRVPVLMSSLSLVMPLGHAQSTVHHASAEPADLAPPAALHLPTPVITPPPAEPAAPPARVVLKRESISAASLFDFDKATLRPEGKVMLDNFCVDLWELRYDRIEVTGHTDRLGSAAHNQKLSQQRAEAAKRYLIQTGRVDASKLVAIGMGERMPMSKPGECKGRAATQKLKECLRLDRRVDVVVTGQR